MVGSKDIDLFNLRENEQIVSPCLIVHGKCNKQNGAKTVQVQHPQLPPITYPIHNQFFKATVILTPGENKLTFVTDTNTARTIVCYYTPLTQNPPVHLCLILAKDSPLQFDSPREQKDREGGNGLELAIKKLRLGARLMQAYTNEQMLRNSMGNRTFPFVEEFTWDTLFERPAMRNTIKIHVVRSEKTVKEIQDPDIAQQNSKGKNTGALFGIAMDALKSYGGPFTNNEKPVQAACMFLDTHWDGKLIRGHAALGGGDDSIKLAVFGSHGLYSWPTCLEQLVPYFTDETRSSTSEVANDCNECGTYWECLTITLGAFMHEIGHLLGCPHQESGVMLRGYTTLNRSFLTKEAYSVRTNSTGASPPIFPKEECTWNRLDTVRFLYHPSFTLPQDYYDPSFMRPTKLGGYPNIKHSVYPLGNGSCRILSPTGIYLIEIICDDLARGHIEYLPVSLGGQGPQREVIVTLDDLRARLPKNELAKFGNTFKLKILSVNAPETEFDKFPSLLDVQPLDMSKYGFSKNVQGIKSPLYGRSDGGNAVGVVAFDVRLVTAVRIYHGYALDGVRFYYKEKPTGTKDAPASKPSVPPRNYFSKITHSIKNHASINEENLKSVLFGHETQNFTDATLEPGEIIIGFNLRCGAWVDAIQIITSHGRMTDMFGNKDGGGFAELQPPNGQYILGVTGRVGQWVDAFGIIYGAL